MSSDRRQEAESIGGRLKRLGLVTLMTIVGLNVWTGSPLLALWVGSRLQGDGPPTMGALFAVVGVLGVVSVILVKVLGELGRAYDELSGTTPTVRQHAPWLRSMRAERPQYEGMRAQLSALEIILIGMVMIAVIAFEVWFFFFSGSPIGGSSGR